MKTSVLLASLVLFTSVTHAQVLKKLKDKVEQKVEKTVNPNASGNNSSTETNTTTSNTNASTAKILTDYCQKVYQLESGESMAYNESRLGFGTDQKGYKIIIKTKNGYKLLENGKTTPLTSPPTELLKDDAEKLHHNVTLSDQEVRSNYVKTNAMYEQIIVYKGKTIATFKMLQGIVVSQDKNHLYAAGTEFINNNMVYNLVSQDGKKTKLPSMPMLVMMSDDGSVGGAAISEYNIQSEKNSNPDPSTMGIMHLYLTNGSVINTTMEDLQGSWIHKAGKLITYKNGQVLVDGKPTFTLSNETSGEVFVNDNLTMAVKVHEGSIEFSDGIKPEWAYSINKVTIDGKTYFSWFTVDFSTKTIYLCKKEF
jgi:hypothetical protein